MAILSPGQKVQLAAVLSDNHFPTTTKREPLET